MDMDINIELVGNKMSINGILFTYDQIRGMMLHSTTGTELLAFGREDDGSLNNLLTKSEWVQSAIANIGITNNPINGGIYKYCIDNHFSTKTFKIIEFTSPKLKEKLELFWDLFKIMENDNVPRKKIKLSRSRSRSRSKSRSKSPAKGIGRNHKKSKKR